MSVFSIPSISFGSHLHKWKLASAQWISSQKTQRSSSPSPNPTYAPGWNTEEVKWLLHNVLYSQKSFLSPNTRFFLIHQLYRIAMKLNGLFDKICRIEFRQILFWKSACLSPKNNTLSQFNNAIHNSKTAELKAYNVALQNDLDGICGLQFEPCFRVTCGDLEPRS